MTILTTELLPTPLLSIGVEADAWLQAMTQVRPDQPILWCPHGHRSGGTPVRSLEHLSVLISALPEPGEWAVIQWSTGGVRRWCQTMRHPSGWVVEAHDGTPDDFAKRVYRGAAGLYPKPTGKRPAHDFELWQPIAAADVIWTWLHGSLPEGSARTMRHMISAVHDHGIG